jgi:hypothetical protein
MPRPPSRLLDRICNPSGTLRYDADYIRGRRVKTTITARSDGTVTLDTRGRDKSALRWLERMQGNKLMKLLDEQDEADKG